IIKNYKYVLPNSYSLDYDTTNVQNGNLLLIKEYINEMAYKNKNIDNIKINDIGTSLNDN
ncbi:MAG: hypothetical protein O7D30_12935, partial [Rickettsia endosymbiont of Ixodes persulcatus]|nr:hypothetical protein [Rickettsia endosymbiont of Ixodes persulcatus]